MSRFTFGAAVGAAAVYFFDPLQGEDRRRRVQSLWRENRDTARQVGAGVSQATESMRPLVRRLKRGLEQGDWAENARASWVPAVTGIFVATAVGGAVVYFLDPQNGLVRRKRIRTFLGEEKDALKEGIRSAQKAAGTVRPRAKHAVAEASKAAEAVMAKARG
jgi:gas vesicle protein